MVEILGLVLAVLTAIAAYVVPAYFGRLKPGYSHLRHTISELGETGSPIGTRVSLWGFVPIGLLLWLFLIVEVSVVPRSASGPFGMLALVGLGYVGGGVFRCDARGYEWTGQGEDDVQPQDAVDARQFGGHDQWPGKGNWP